MESDLGVIVVQIGRILAGLIAAGSIIYIAYSGYQIMSASGDPQKESRAKMSLVGSLIGLGVAGMAFVLPGFVVDTVIRPAGGEVLDVTPQANCDRALQRQLTGPQGQANTATRVNRVISLIQQTQSGNCGEEEWNPQAGNLTAVTRNVTDGTVPSTNPVRAATCDFKDVSRDAVVGGGLVPSGLRDGNNLSGKPVAGTKRDGRGNFLIYWITDGGLPSDQRDCWLYRSEERVWYTSNHNQP